MTLFIIVFNICFKTLVCFQSEMFQGILGDSQGTLIEPYINDNKNYLNEGLMTRRIKN